MNLKVLCVYCGSSAGLLPEYLQTASLFGAHLAAQGITVVYGGGRVGMMGSLADGALQAGGRVVGVIPEALMARELAHLGLTELHVVKTMHERKLKMASLADAFVALPGGIGTLEEILEVFTWTHLDFQSKPCAFLDVAGYYTPLVTFLGRVVDQGFLRRERLDALIVDTDMVRLLSRLDLYEHLTLDHKPDTTRRMA